MQLWTSTWSEILCKFFDHMIYSRGSDTGPSMTVAAPSPQVPLLLQTLQTSIQVYIVLVGYGRVAMTRSRTYLCNIQE